VGNPTGFPDRMERAWPKFKSLNANTIEFPIYWEQIEPVEEKFDFSDLDKIILACARRAAGRPALVRHLQEWSDGLCARLGQD